jgi:hypothetical protein
VDSNRVSHRYPLNSLNGFVGINAPSAGNVGNENADKDRANRRFLICFIKEE